ncbi:MAPEG family protein [Methylocapsa acidiphila]|uniref:MAPEG family protein n=1 Tax=Methylocapsa acidiphila TaxID=133552 RepID=UPI00040DA275|nr:MAPEG family protein [Methylocapsa acidiphila]
MTIQSILLPLFVQIGLTFSLVLWAAIERRNVLLRGELTWRDIALKQTPWPGRALQVSQSFANQFEIPVLYYVLVLLALATKKADLAFVVMEWLFVSSRLAHAYVHTTSNHVPTRGKIFVVGVVILVLMWAIFAIRILLAPSFGGL